MKRMLISICVLFLMLDLANDGSLGKAKFVNPPSPVKSLEVFSHYYGSEAPDCYQEILPSNPPLPFPQFRSQSTKPLVQQSRKIIFISYLNSAGGLPGQLPTLILPFYRSHPSNVLYSHGGSLGLTAIRKWYSQGPNARPQFCVQGPQEERNEETV
jgi:hypothetical protein